MIDVDKFHLENAQFHFISRAYHPFGDVLNTMLLYLIIRQHQRQLSAIDRRSRVKLLEQIRNSADMIFMTVR